MATTAQELRERIETEERAIEALQQEIEALSETFRRSRQVLLDYVEKTGDASVAQWVTNETKESNNVAVITNKTSEELADAKLSASGNELLHLEYVLRLEENLHAQLEIHKQYLKSAIDRVRVKVSTLGTQ
jgi:hypothetical protein